MGCAQSRSDGTTVEQADLVLIGTGISYAPPTAAPTPPPMVFAERPLVDQNLDGSICDRSLDASLLIVPAEGEEEEAAAASGGHGPDMSVSAARLRTNATGAQL